MKWSLWAALLCATLSCQKEPRPEPLPAPSSAKREPSGRAGFFGKPVDGKLHVYFFDVGQGDAALILSPTGESVLLDAGPPAAGSHLAHRLPELLRGPLNWALLTQGHPEHSGGLNQALSRVGVDLFFNAQSTPERAEDEALRRQLEVAGIRTFRPATAGLPFEILLGGGVHIRRLWPPPEGTVAAIRETSDDARSAVFRVEYGATSFLLTSDATAYTEEMLVRGRSDLKSTVLKVAAHGSAWASQQAFLQAVQPSAAVISVGAGNQREAPSRQTLQRLEKVGTQVFRTDLDGEMHAISDGRRVFISTERSAVGDEHGTAFAFSTRAVRARKYVAPKNSRVFHAADCPSVRRVTQENLEVFDSRAQALKNRRPAPDCNP